MQCLPAFVLALWIGIGPQQSGPLTELTMPYGRVHSLPSPDGTQTLYGVAFQEGKNDGPQLWIKNNLTGAPKLLLSIGGTLQAVWAPDGKAFSVNDHWASDSENGYIYDAQTLKRQNVGDDILAADSESKQFINAHSYFHIERWDGPEHVLAQFHGHTDEAPVQCFDFKYRVNRNGTVEKLSRRVHPIDKSLTCS